MSHRSVQQTQQLLNTTACGMQTPEILYREWIENTHVRWRLCCTNSFHTLYGKEMEMVNGYLLHIVPVSAVVMCNCKLCSTSPVHIQYKHYLQIQYEVVKVCSSSVNRTLNFKPSFTLTKLNAQYLTYEVVPIQTLHNYHIDRKVMTS